MTGKLKVAVAQMDIVPLDLQANLQKHLETVARARGLGVDVLVFPELSLSGYLVGERGYSIGIEVNDPLDDPFLAPIAEATGDMMTVVGFVEEGYGAQFFNAAAVFQNGREIHVHRKLNLANYGDMEEAKFFAKGRFIDKFKMASSFVGSVLLCSDMWNPALVHLAALHGATMLLVPTNSSLDSRSNDFSKPGRWDLVLEFYASLYGLPIAFCNRVGTEGVHRFWGGSRILDPHGAVLARATGDEEVLLTAEIDYMDVRKARHALPTVRDSNLDLINREVSRLVDSVGVPSVVRK